MCATSHPAATLAVIETLKAGGNAVDAAIVASGILAVVEAPMTGIGGDCFAMIAKPGQDKLIGFNSAGRAPKAATPEWFASKKIGRIETTSAHAVTVPGAVDGWIRLLEDHGTMPLERVLAPAIELAENGFAVAPRIAADWAHAVPKLSAGEGARRNLLKKDGSAPVAGEIMRFPALARTLKIIAKEGRDGFYKGEVAEDMVAELKALGGLHTLDDFAAQSRSATYVEPVICRYRDFELAELPPSNQGITALIMLKMLERLGGAMGGPVSVERYHVLMEAARLAYAMRDAFVADPDAADVPVAHMLDDKVIDGLVARIDRKKHRPELGPVPRPGGSDTVCFSIVDEDGMAISFINSLYGDFGSGIATVKTGVNFHNRGEGFVLNPAHANCIAPRKRPLHTQIPAMALKGGTPYMAFGVMGAHFQPIGHVYIVNNIFGYGMDPQEALDTPRMFFEGDQIVAEESVPDAVVAGLEAMGHKVIRRRMPWGGGQIVIMDRANGVLIGASDGRKDGMALGY
jgi:gamma-glutamyltranspeptidase/glutathione hydrolase